MSEELQAPAEGQQVVTPEPATAPEGSQNPENPEAQNPTSGDDGGADPEAVEADKALKKGRNYYARKIDQTTREREEARRESAEMREMLKAMIGQRQPPQQGPAQQVEQAPTKDQFPDYESYLEAKAEHKARQTSRQEQENFLRNLQAAATQQTNYAQAEQQDRDFAAKREAGVKAIPDFHAVIEEAADTPVMPHVAQAIKFADDPAAVMYALAKNPQLAMQLNQMHPGQVLMKIGALQAAAKAAPKTTNAPAPGKPVGARGGRADGYRENMTQDEYMKWRGYKK